DGVIPGTRQWTALVPEARLAAFEAQLQDLSHAEFLDRQRAAGRASPRTGRYSGLGGRISLRSTAIGD
ncbi:MAG: hypothetical protein KGO02_18610, partial [Alphaproteobacteria bacterium]|nr:hypothetical protein [Alphaproteobacteria bacterium]